MEPYVLVRHLAEEFHLNRKDQRGWRLYKVWAPSKIIIFDGVQIDTVLTRGDCSGVGIWYKEISGTALAGFEPVTICFRDCFKMPRELRGGEGGVQVKNHCVGLRPAPPLAEARVTQLATASFREFYKCRI